MPAKPTTNKKKDTEKATEKVVETVVSTEEDHEEHDGSDNGNESGSSDAENNEAGESDAEDNDNSSGPLIGDKAVSAKEDGTNVKKNDKCYQFLREVTKMHRNKNGSITIAESDVKRVEKMVQEGIDTYIRNANKIAMPGLVSEAAVFKEMMTKDHAKFNKTVKDLNPKDLKWTEIKNFSSSAKYMNEYGDEFPAYEKKNGEIRKIVFAEVKKQNEPIIKERNAAAKTHGLGIRKDAKGKDQIWDENIAKFVYVKSSKTSSTIKA